MNLFDIIKSIFDNKLKIILTTLIVTLFSVQYSSKQPEEYQITVNISPSKPSTFNSYKNINETLEWNSYTPSINAQSIFKKFIYEVNNYDSIIVALKNNSFIKEKLINLDEASRQSILSDYAQSYKISVSKDFQSLTITFQWHNSSEASVLIQDVIQNTLQNVKEDISSEIKQSSLVIDLIDANSLEQLKFQSKDIIELEQIKNKSRIFILEEELNQLESQKKEILVLEKRKLESQILILEEYYSVAKDLGIEKPIYLRSTYPVEYFQGYKVLEKKINMLKSRTNDQLILSSVETIDIQQQIIFIKKQINSLNKRTNDQLILISADFILLKEKINGIKNSLSSSVLELNETLKILKKDSLNDWVNYNMYDVKITSLNVGSKRFIGLGVIFGLLISILYVLSVDIIRELKRQIKP